MSLVACEEAGDFEALSTGKEPIDVTKQMELSNVTPVDIYDNSIVVRRKVDIKDLKDTRFDLDVIKRDDILDVEILQVPKGVDVLDFVEEMRASGNFEFVEPNIKIGLNPPDPVEGIEMRTDGRLDNNVMPTDPE